MKFKYLLIGTSLSLIPQTINAQCVATQDCATLGYTETSCSGGSGVKCPFGNKWACFKSGTEYEQEFCSKYGFTETCTKKNQIGYGIPCNGKYIYCTCSEGYELADGTCKEIMNGPAGDVYKCEGEVVAVKVPGTNTYIAMRDLGRKVWDDGLTLCLRYSFCGTLMGVMPEKGFLQNYIYRNKNEINNLLEKYGGQKLDEYFYWSSQVGYAVHMYTGMAQKISINTAASVRPVLPL